MCAHILVAEDDEMQAELVRRCVEAHGHTATVVHDGRSAVDEVRRSRPDLLVLDVMLPEIDGWGVCRILRPGSDLPVLMLTARSHEDDLLLGLELGADDYMTKPYSPRELMARIHALLRRVQRPAVAADGVLWVDTLAVDPARRAVTCAGEPVVCTPGEFEILRALAAEPDRVFTRGQLLECVRGYERAISERAIDVHILNLRKKIELDPRKPARLLTVFGVGYKLTGGRRGP
ncbi:response regulator transcription factor [Streptomyces sp. H39-S7]|uniref:response regulator transcription factor n=1 Tax=Streptomyces sp. H39-S7 TaxID=3004357 RepID=UPI0022AF8A2F|nr:response regulator transcription factor [Streptomyces sp. H39-S7]MCZ4123595.1 response regulator transcription factor [Streptomyces sp. H39-S7]